MTSCSGTDLPSGESVELYIGGGAPWLLMDDRRIDNKVLLGINDRA